jgi:hypothetical protein
MVVPVNGKAAHLIAEMYPVENAVYFYAVANVVRVSVKPFLRIAKESAQKKPLK